MKGIISRQRPDSTQQQRDTGKEPFRSKHCAFSGLIKRKTRQK